MLPRCSYLFALATTACLAVPGPISAALINYAFDQGTTACFGNCDDDPTKPPGSRTETITGYFVFDTGAIPGPLPQVNIMLTDSGGPLLPNGSVGFLEGENSGTHVIRADNASEMINVQITFVNSLADGTHNDLESFQLTIGPPVDFEEIADHVTGAVSPFIVGSVPEPTSFALMGAALALFFLGWQRKFTQLQR